MTIVNTVDRDWHLLSLKRPKPATVSTSEVDLLNSAIRESTPRCWLPIMAYEEPSIVTNVDYQRGFDSTDQTINGWLSLIREKLYSTRSVEGIFVDIEDNDVDIWVVIPERDLAVLDQLAYIEWELLELFVSGRQPVFLIDFHIIYRCGRDIEDLAPTTAIRLSREV